MKIIILPLFLFIVLHATAQIGERYNETSINLHSAFVKASQKKLLRKYDDAIKIYEGILEKDMHNAVALFDLSRIYMTMTKEDKALEYAEKALKKDPNNTWYRESLAEINMRFEHYSEAAQMFKEMAFAKENNQNLYLNAIEAYQLDGDRAGTLSILVKMEKVFGTDSFTAQQIIAIHIDQGKYKSAIAKAKELVKLYPYDTEYIQVNAELEADFGSEKEAERLFKSLLAMDPENSKALVFLALKSDKNNGINGIRSIVSNPNVDIDEKVKALIPFAQIITAKSPDKEEILAMAKTVVSLHPDEAKAYAIYADILKNSGNIIDAEVQYIESLKYDKSIFAIWQELMVIQYEIEKYAGLISTCNLAMDFYPNHAAPYAFNGLAKVNINQYTEGKEMLAEAQLIGTSDDYIKSIIHLLSVSIQVYENGGEIKVMSKQDMFMRGINPDDSSVISKRADGKYLVKIKKGS
ncbi:MAG: tetratricopeptide repeat protein [Saprospiraceae bacterium]